MYRPYDALDSDIVYAGSVNKERNKFWNVRLSYQRKRIFGKWLLFAKHGGEAECKKVAYSVRQQLSDEHGLTLRRPVVPRNVTEYIAGFIDGDGCLTVNNKGKMVHVRITQAQENGVPPVLEFIKKWYGGSLTTPRRRKSTHRNIHELCIQGPYAVWLMRDLLNTSMIKHGQVLDSLKLIATERSQRTELLHKLKTAKKKSEMQKIEFNNNDVRLTWAYIAGLFDAEGSVAYRDGIRTVLAQSSNRNILLAIKHKLNLTTKGVHGDAVLCVSGHWAERMIRNLLPYSIVKREQMEHALLIRALMIRKMSSPSVANILAVKLTQMKKV